MRTFQLAWISRRRTTMCPLSTRRTFQSWFREKETRQIRFPHKCIVCAMTHSTSDWTDISEDLWKCCASNSCFDLGSWSSGLAAAQSWLAALRLLLHSPATARCQQHDGGLGSSAHCLGDHHWTSLGLTMALSPPRQVWDGFKTVLQVTSDQKPWLAIPKMRPVEEITRLLRNKELCSRSRLEALRAASVRETKSKREATYDTWRLRQSLAC